MFWIVLNLIYIGLFVAFYHYMRKNHGWFTDTHVPVPEWLAFALGLFGFFIPMTPLFIDGMLIGTVVYFLNEGVYRSTGWSPLSDSYVWVREKLSKRSA